MLSHPTGSSGRAPEDGNGDRRPTLRRPLSTEPDRGWRRGPYRTLSDPGRNLRERAIQPDARGASATPYDPRVLHRRPADRPTKRQPSRAPAALPVRRPPDVRRRLSAAYQPRITNHDHASYS